MHIYYSHDYTSGEVRNEGKKGRGKEGKVKKGRGEWPLIFLFRGIATFHSSFFYYYHFPCYFHAKYIPMAPGKL